LNIAPENITKPKRSEDKIANYFTRESQVEAS
jgi:hypothetical protein